MQIPPRGAAIFAAPLPHRASVLAIVMMTLMLPFVGLDETSQTLAA